MIDLDVNLENHKGTPCPYVKSPDFLFCQEQCNDCEIYNKWHEKWKENEKKMGYKLWKGSK